MKFEQLSALKLGTLVRRRIVSPVELLSYFENRIEQINPKINAFTYTRFDEAMQQAKEIERLLDLGVDPGPLAGVPIGLKDFLPTKKGWTHSHGGVESIAHMIDEVNSPFTAAAESLGAIAIGKTNSPAFGFRGATDNKMFGPTSTPFNPAFNSGGSSGGSAAAVGAGLVGLAEGGDAGGSIRIPAAWCGCFGFKPSAGVVPSVCRPDAWAATHPYCCGGPISRTVSDAAVIVDSMIRYDQRDPLSVYMPEVMKSGVRDTSLLTKKRPLEKWRIGITYNFDLFPTPESEIQAAIDKIASILTQYGAEVGSAEFSFNYSRKEIEDAWLRGICIDTALDMEEWKKNGYDLVKDHADQVPEEFIKWNDIALHSTMSDYRKFHEIRTDILDAHCNVFDEFDVIIAPVAGCMPVPNTSDGSLVKGPSFINGDPVDPLIGFSYTYLENMIGTPAASIPAAMSSNGFPIGVQIIAPRYRDSWVFQVAYCLEEANPWSYDIPFTCL